MLRIDWSNPKITMQQFDEFLSPYLGSNFDGLLLENNFIYVRTLDDQITEEQETHILDYIYSLNNIPRSVTLTSAVDNNPFAVPTYRTKLDATVDIVEIQINSNSAVDFKILEERYVSGGEMIVLNAEFGDYITAEVHDLDGVIPAPYRSALCENWPTISTYIVKKWVPAEGEGKITRQLIDMRPLNAKITANIYLRVKYYAINSGSTRKLLVNYDLTKKL